nr:unnamed protein product [Digitaria exilis]
MEWATLQSDVAMWHSTQAARNLEDEYAYLEGILTQAPIANGLQASKLKPPINSNCTRGSGSPTTRADGDIAAKAGYPADGDSDGGEPNPGQPLAFWTPGTTRGRSVESQWKQTHDDGDATGGQDGDPLAADAPGDTHPGRDRPTRKGSHAMPCHAAAVTGVSRALGLSQPLD